MPDSVIPFADMPQPFKSMHERLAGSEVENAGIIGPGWFTISAGTAFGVPLSEGMFTWHSHMTENLFSTDDLLIFVYSYAAVTALFLPHGLVIAIKGNEAWAIREKVLKKFVISSGNPFLTIQRLSRCVSDVIGVAVWDVQEDELAERLEIKIIMDSPE